MSTITLTEPSMAGVSSVAKSFSWTPLTETNADGSAANVAFATVSITVQVRGTFGGTSVAIEGSMDGTNWFTCKDATGTAIAITSAGGCSLSDLPVYIRPKLTGGSSASITVVALVR